MQLKNLDKVDLRLRVGREEVAAVLPAAVDGVGQAHLDLAERVADAALRRTGDTFQRCGDAKNCVMFDILMLPPKT